MANITIAQTCSRLLLPSSHYAPFDTTFRRRRTTTNTASRNHGSSSVRNIGVVRCTALGTEATEPKAKKKSSYEIETLTHWLLKQEQNGVIDSELTIVLSSISTACKQIASLVQRANISNLTGVQGAVNIQGEDQKKLDVISNEVYIWLYTYIILPLRSIVPVSHLAFRRFHCFFFFLPIRCSPVA